MVEGTEFRLRHWTVWAVEGEIGLVLVKFYSDCNASKENVENIINMNNMVAI